MKKEISCTNTAEKMDRKKNWRLCKATKEQRNLRMDIIAPLFKRGYSYRNIREEVMSRLDLDTYSLKTVKSDIDALLKEWRELRIANIDLSIQLELQRIDDLIKEAWDAWDKSKEDYERKSDSQDAAIEMEGCEEDGDGKIIPVRARQQRESVRSCGDPRYLDIINKLLIERRKLLGLYAPEKQNVSIKSALKDMSDEELECEVNRLRKLNGYTG